MCSRQHLHNTETEDLMIVSAKNPLKVKLENLHNSRVPELGEIMRILVCEGFGVFIVV